MAPREITCSALFEDNLKKLAKKERAIDQVAREALSEIAAAEHVPGDQIPGLGGAPVYKLRLACGNRGKRGGYRLIFYCAERLVRGMFVYKKTETEDIPTKVIAFALKAAGLIEDES